ncbi:hypothetical protein KJ854_05975 [Patescibacteria group bacterium]|nr:hypothetical protein [Patescibacteria group bacterium]
MIKITGVFNTISRIKELIYNLQYLEDYKEKSKIGIDKIDFVTPLSITPVAAVINKKQLKYSYNGENILYLKTIRFPDGVKEIDKISAQKTYFPIIHLGLKSLSKTDIANQLGLLHTKYLDLIKNNIIADQRFLELVTNNTFGLLLGEIFDNIEEHSDAENVYLFGQYWPKTNACEICVLDDGQGIHKSLIKAGRNVKDSEDALRKILETGLSAKTEFGSIKRATGIKNIRSAIINKEINGEFLIMSGDSIFLDSAIQGEKFIKLTKYFWDGTIITLRLNRPISKYNLYNYVK